MHPQRLSHCDNVCCPFTHRSTSPRPFCAHYTSCAICHSCHGTDPHGIIMSSLKSSANNNNNTLDHTILSCLSCHRHTRSQISYFINDTSRTCSVCCQPPPIATKLTKIHYRNQCQLPLASADLLLSFEIWSTVYVALKGLLSAAAEPQN